jgi:hypothetical protein
MRLYNTSQNHISPFQYYAELFRVITVRFKAKHSVSDADVCCLQKVLSSDGVLRKMFISYQCSLSELFSFRMY